MQPPCEIMVNDFLPAIRGLVSHELREKGESQRQIAVLLGITQARVSYYLGNKKSTFVNELSIKFGVPISDILGYSKILSEDVSRSQVDGIFTLYSIWKNLLYAGSVCSIHQRGSRISSECSVCMELHKPARESGSDNSRESEDNEILKDISDAVAMLESSATFPNLIPEVAVNIASSRKSPQSMRDVASIPGRINKIHGRARSFVPPEFGCSNHSTRVLLLFNNKDSRLRAVMNLKYDKLIEKSTSLLGFPVIFTSHLPDGSHRQSRGEVEEQNVGSSPQDQVLWRLARIVMPSALTESTPIAIIDKGSEGVEPITYLIGEKASEVAQLALKISHSYSNLMLDQ